MDVDLDAAAERDQVDGVTTAARSPVDWSPALQQTCSVGNQWRRATNTAS